MPDPQTHVIVGAGLAGAKAAEALRDEGFEGRILLVGDEPEYPYERPPLSKEYLRGEALRAKGYVHPGGFYVDQGIDLRLDTTVDRIDTFAQKVELEDGERLRYDRLLIATGAAPARLPVRGADLPGIYYLRNLRDADVLAARLNAGGRLVVIGGGWIGCEVAASARLRGIDVTLVEVGAAPLGRVLGRDVGRIYAEIHREHGVELHLGVALEAFEGAGRVERVRLSDGRTIECDFAVAAVGAIPRTELAEWAGIATDNGVVVSERLETSVRGVFAAGDVASAFHPFYRSHLRVEHWANALHQGQAAARAMLGRPDPYDRLPYFYSDQYEVGMEYTGHASEWDQVVLRGDVAGREFIAFWLRDGRVLAGMNVNVWDVADDIAALIRSREPVSPELLRDTDVPLAYVAHGGGHHAPLPPAA